MASHNFRVIVTDIDPSLPGSGLGQEIVLSSESSHHVATVLHRQEGDTLIVAFSEINKSFSAVITELRPAVKLKLIAEEQTAWRASPVRALIAPILRGDHSDLVIEKASELGVSTIILWRADRSVIQLKSPDVLKNKIARWERIAQSAAQQSGRNGAAEIKAVQDLAAALALFAQARLEKELLLICSLDPSAQALKDLNSAPYYSVLIGPEADFTDAEISLAQAAGALPVTLGPWILRSETAAIAACAAINALNVVTPDLLRKSTPEGY